MANYRYTYEYNGRRYVIEAPEGATAADLQAIVDSSAQPAAPPPAAPAPKAEKKEEESFLSGVIPTLKSAVGDILSTSGLALQQAYPTIAKLLPDKAPLIGLAGSFSRTTGKDIKTKAEAELPEASRAERRRQQEFIRTAKPGLGSEILAGIGRAGAALPSFTDYDIGGLSRRFLPQTPEQAAPVLAAVQAPFQTGRGAAEFIASQAPSTLIPFGGGKAAQIGGRLFLPRVGREAAEAVLAREIGTGVTVTGGALNAASAGSQAYEDVLAKGGTKEEADRAFKIAYLGAAAVSGAASRMPGLEQQAFSGKPKTGGVLRSAGRAIVGETPQEFVEEAGSQLATNIGKLGTAAEVPVGQDVLSSGLLGGIGGATIAAPIGGLEGLVGERGTKGGAGEDGAPRAPRTPPRAPPPPADMDALVKSLGPVGSKITLQEPSGEQEYTFEGFDEDGSVVLSDADGLTFAEDPDQIAAAMKAGVADSEEGLGGIAFGMDITEGLEEEAPPAPPVAKMQTTRTMAESATVEKIAPTINEYTISDAIDAEGPEDVRLVRRPDRSYIQRTLPNGNTQMIDVSPQVEAGLSDEEIIASRIGEDTTGKNVTAKAAAPAVAAPTPPPAAPASESIAPPEVMPIDEDVGPYMQDYARFRTAEQMAQIEDDARRVASERGATSVSKEDMYKAAIAFDNARFKPSEKPKFTIEPEPLEPPAPAQMSPEDAKKLAEEEDFLARLDDDLSYISETRAENAYEGEDPETKAAYEEEISALNEAREKTLKTIASIKGKYAAPSAAQPVAAPPAPPRAVGKTDRATIPATREKVDVQYELQDLDNIRFAEDELQNRDRSRPASDAFITDFVNNFDPDGVGEDRSTDRGAPIINKDNIILSGNGRTMGLEEIYNFHPDKAEIYKESLRELGYDIEGIERPLLVRRLKSDVDERKFVTASNEPDVAALSPPEQAAQDARDILTPAVLSKYNGGDLKAAKNDAFVSAFLAEMNPQQRKNAMDDKGKVNAQTLKRIENALLYKAYGGAGRASKIFISKAMERSDDDTKTLTNSLVDVANDWIKFQQAIENGEIDKKYDITNKLLEMVGTVSDIKASGNSVSGAMRSPDMVEPMDPFVRDILLAFHDDKTFRILSRKAIAEKLRAYTEVAANQQAAPDMFGKAETPSARDIWRRVDEGEGAPQSDLYASIEPIPAEQEEVIDEARKVPSLSRGVAKLIKQRDQGLIDDAEFSTRVTELADFIDYMKDEKNYRVAKKGRVRDADRILSVLYDERRRGNVDPDSVDFIAWVLKGNPSLAEGLAVAIKKPGKKSPAGNYDDVRRLMTLFKKRNADTTAVHELLHHTERMMPPDVQQAIRLAWLREFKKEEAKAKAKDGTSLKTYFQVLRAFHTRQKFTIGPDTFSPQQGMAIALGMLNDGFVPYSYYQYINPTEFWAVNATQIMKKRFGVSDSIIGRLRNWLSELVEKAKGLFNLSAKSPLIKALDSLAKADGKFNSLTMLQEEGARYLEPETKGKAEPEIYDNKQAMKILITGTPDQMRKAVAKAQEPDDKINGEAADLQKKNRGCD